MTLSASHVTDQIIVLNSSSACDFVLYGQPYNFDDESSLLSIPEPHSSINNVGSNPALPATAAKLNLEVADYITLQKYPGDPQCLSQSAAKVKGNYNTQSASIRKTSKI